ncbi:MAG: hypothetical protein GXY83_18165 [Rhodopirellula sp.]|nr:hypothetical protein [Rhodopirellula sp.]
MTLFGYADPARAIESGRRSLDRWWGYPWYDPAGDDLERIDVSQPWWFDWFPDWQGLSMGRWPNNLLEWLAWIVIAACLALLVWVLVRAYRSRGRNAGITNRRSATDEDAADQRRRIEALPLPSAGRQLDFLAEAERHYREGRYGTATAYLFSYQLIQLDRHRRLHLARGKTNRQYLRELGSGTALGGLLKQTMIAFEDAFFGHHEIDRIRFESCWSRLGEFESLAAEGRG